jgi:hypothetical protein
MILLAWALTVWSWLLAITDADEGTAATFRIHCRSITFSFSAINTRWSVLISAQDTFDSVALGGNRRARSTGSIRIQHQVGCIASPLISKSRSVPWRPDRHACCCDFIRSEKSHDMVNIDCEWIISSLIFLARFRTPNKRTFSTWKICEVWGG